MSKDASNPQDKSGTPASLLVSIVCAIIVFALAEFQNTLSIGESFSMRSVLVAYIALGLALAFFWKRFERSPFLKISSGAYLFGLWVSLFMTTLAPVLLRGESPLAHGHVMQQFGFGSAAFSGLMLVVALLQSQKMVPSLVLSSLGAVGLIASAGAGLFVKSGHDGDGSIVFHSPKNSDHSDGEEISVHKQGGMAAKTSARDLFYEVTEDKANEEDGEEEEAHEGHDEASSVFSKPKPKAKKEALVPATSVASLESAFSSREAVADSIGSCGVSAPLKNIPSAWPKMKDVSLDYKLTSLSIVDKGKTVQFDVGKQNFMKIAGRKYELVQFHIQAPSTHSIDGRASPLEAHFVHKDQSGKFAVLGVMIEAGAENKAFGEMLEFLPQSLNNPATPVGRVFNIAGLVPAHTKVYRYRGLHATPPCADDVLWSLSSEKMTLSPKQIEAFHKRYRGNIRPGAKANLAH